MLFREAMQVQLALPLGLTETPQEIFWRVYCEIRVKSRRTLAVSEAVVTWRAYTNSIGIVRVRNGRLEVSLSEALREAPPEVVEALAEILVAKLFGRKAPAEFQTRYRSWLHHGETRQQLDAVRRERGRKRVANEGGRHYDLDEIFEKVNRKYFEGRLAKPVLAWSVKASRTHLGHWDPVHTTIVLSRALDSLCVPALAVEYVMYHEMLHTLHPVEHDGARRRVHTRSFKAAEKKFEGLKEVRDFLRRFSAHGLSF